MTLSEVVALEGVARASTQIQLTVPVWGGNLAPPRSVKGNYCNVAVVKAGRRVIVRAGPGTQFGTIDALISGRTVYTCNEQGAWVGVAYRGARRQCDGATKLGLDVRLSRHCRSGWAPKRDIDVLSG
jgi:hypothetical protein